MERWSLSVASSQSYWFVGRRIQGKAKLPPISTQTRTTCMEPITGSCEDGEYGDGDKMEVTDTNDYYAWIKCLSNVFSLKNCI